MKFDTIIIGGGLCGLTAGIELSRKGQKCLIVSSGQSALHFFSGSFELCSLSDNPYDAMSSFDETHPYSRIGIERVRDLAAEVKPFFKEVGITLKGAKDANHWRIINLSVKVNFHNSGSDISCSRSIAGAVIGAVKVVINGLRNAYNVAIPA